MSKKTLTQRRLFILGAIKISTLCCLTSRLYYLQIREQAKYKSLANKNRLRSSVANYKRGDITDRNGIKIAYDKKQYDLIFDPIKNVNIKDAAQNLLHILNLPEHHHLYNVINNAQETTVILENLDWDTIQKIEFNLINLNGLFTISSYKRYYPCREALSHILGYVRKRYQDRLYSYTGEIGIEYLYDDELTGKPDIVQKEVNAKMEVKRYIHKIMGKASTNIQLSIDSNLQQFVYHKALRASGSVVVVDVRTGNILAMNSSPSYDNNIFTHLITDKTWHNLKDNKSYPLLNRAVKLEIPPASTFKLVAALSALKNNIIKPHTKVFCSGAITIGKTKFRCWKRDGHGLINLNEAIASSCNVYFYYIARKIDINDLCATANELGLGKLTGTGLIEESKGLIPSQEWRDKNVQHWYLGDTLNTIIGHGYVLSTPLQLALMTAKIATGKNVLPSFTHYNSKKPFETLPFNQQDLRIVKNGMYTAVNSSMGSGNKAYSNLEIIAGKTGTSELTKSVKNHQVYTKSSLFVGYAPYNNPKYAISVVIQGNQSVIASKVAKQVLEYIFVHID